MAKPKAKAKAKAKARVKAKAKPKAKAKVKPKAKATSRPTAKPRAKPKAKRAVRRSPSRLAQAERPAQVYTSQVADIITARPRASSYPPITILNLSLARVRAPQSVDELSPTERAQLEVIWHPMPLAQVLGNEEYSVEVAEVVDPMGTLRFHLYGWNYGVGYLMAPGGMNVVAFASQHDLEHWNLDQRDLFVAMDAAMRAPDHGFQQPLSFCWWDDSCWAALAGKEPGSIGSEPHLRQTFAATLAERAARAN
jgi:hypothetical protein